MLVEQDEGAAVEQGGPVLEGGGVEGRGAGGQQHGRGGGGGGEVGLVLDEVADAVLLDEHALGVAG